MQKNTALNRPLTGHLLIVQELNQEGGVLSGLILAGNVLMG